MSKKKIKPKVARQPEKQSKYAALVVIILMATLGFGAVLSGWRGLPGLRSLISRSPRVLQPESPAPIPSPSNPSKEYIYGGSKLIAIETVKSDQSITFNSIASKTYGDSPFAITATASSGLSVSFTVTAGPATLSGNTLTITGAGSVSIRADQAGNDGFNPAQSVTQSFNVAEASATITLGSLNQTYDGTPRAVTATTNPTGLSSISFTYNGSSTAPTNAGSYSVVASLTNDNYTASNATGTLTIAKAAQTITFNTLADKTYGDAPFTVSASSSSGLTVSFSIVSGPATVSGTTITITGTGTVTVRASQAGNSNYSAAADVDRSFNVDGYTYRRSITIDHTKVPNSDWTNFPLLVSGTYSYLATTAHGGNVQNTNGYDIIFASDSVCATKLNHEVETYNATTGTVNYWVKVPTVSHTSDTVIYMCYGNSSITTDQSNKTAVWDANYKGVWHLPNGSSLSTNDSTANGGNGTNHSATAVSGRIDGGAGFDGSSQYISVPQIAATTTTVEHWVYFTGTTNFVVMADAGWNSTDGFVTAITAGQHAFVKQAVAVVYSGTNSAVNTWEHVVWTVGADNKARLYVNGALSYTDTDTQAIISQTHSAALGARLDVSGNPFKYFPGILDEVRISNIARSADWVATEYNNQSSPATFYTISSPL